MILEALTISLGFSIHAGFDGGYNNFHPHIRYEHQQFIAGTYYNSIEDISFYGGYRQEKGNFGIELAAVTGYDYAITPYIRGTYDTGKLRFYAAPGVENDNVGVVFGLEIPLK
jgi:hypothetical protein